jgi:hypothetical protein
MLCGVRIEIVVTNFVVKTIKKREDQSKEKYQSHVSLSSSQAHAAPLQPNQGLILKPLYLTFYLTKFLIKSYKK